MQFSSFVAGCLSTAIRSNPNRVSFFIPCNCKYCMLLVTIIVIITEGNVFLKYRFVAVKSDNHNLKVKHRCLIWFINNTPQKVSSYVYHQICNQIINT
jgi:hypothetical protein